MPPKLPTLIAIAVVVLVGSVEMGGMTRAQARAAIGERLLKPLDEPLIIQAAGRPFPLSAREAQITANVDAMVSAAVRRSREGGVLARTWRAISAGAVGARLPFAISYSRPAVQRIVDRVRVRAAAREPQRQPRRVTLIQHPQRLTVTGRHEAQQRLV